MRAFDCRLTRLYSAAGSRFRQGGGGGANFYHPARSAGDPRATRAKLPLQFAVFTLKLFVRVGEIVPPPLYPRHCAGSCWGKMCVSVVSGVSGRGGCFEDPLPAPKLSLPGHRERYRRPRPGSIRDRRAGTTPAMDADDAKAHAEGCIRVHEYQDGSCLRFLPLLLWLSSPERSSRSRGCHPAASRRLDSGRAL